MSEATGAQFPRETSRDGEFVRQSSAFRHWISRDGSTLFPAEAGRYHLYVSLACPWAHRSIILRKLKQLESAISMSIVDPIRDHRGWAFTGDAGSDLDSVNGFEFLSQAYEAANPSYEGRCSVPVLWDKRRGTIVNNESSEIIRMLNSEMDEWGDAGIDVYPESLRDEIDAINARVYAAFNNGVYCAGFAATQAAYERACVALFAMLDEMEEILSRRRYLVGDRLSEADWRAFTTLVRFDPVYHGHFKCNLRRLVDYPNLWGYTRELYQYPGVAETVNMDHIKRHYYVTHQRINPSQVVPIGPDIDYASPHDRG